MGEPILQKAHLTVYATFEQILKQKCGRSQPDLPREAYSRKANRQGQKLYGRDLSSTQEAAHQRG